MDPETPCPYLFGPRRYIPPQLREVTSTQDDLLAASQRQAQREATQAQHVFSQLLANYEKPVEMYQSFIDSFPAEDLHNSCAVRAWLTSWFNTSGIFDSDIGVGQYVLNNPLNGKLLRTLNDVCIRVCLNKMNVEIDRKTKLYPQNIIDELIKCVLWARSVHLLNEAEKKRIEEEKKKKKKKKKKEKAENEKKKADEERNRIKDEAKLAEEEKKKAGEDKKKPHALTVTLPNVIANSPDTTGSMYVSEGHPTNLMLRYQDNAVRSYTAEGADQGTTHPQLGYMMGASASTLPQRALNIIIYNTEVERYQERERENVRQVEPESEREATRLFDLEREDRDIERRQGTTDALGVAMIGASASTLPQATLNTDYQDRMWEAVATLSGTGTLHQSTQKSERRNRAREVFERDLEREREEQRQRELEHQDRWMERWMESGRERQRERERERAKILSAEANQR